ncbi:hypothetical protein GALMADRAFT_54096 [Galerina marginata CBS 339.88]|uniref:methylated diphthine methylhydrolase n=1 Tax=Galerina marginata (strain CBS 339.88) TaxID=685588 RepID=A0A067TRT0_GALM3|nr:hypothetical protein GALMADRAFT_54096 [Galerina marginata CBS 339.88]
MAAFDTTFPADSLEFCPTIGFQDIFVCGTYKLLDQPALVSDPKADSSSKVLQTRRGQCLAFRVRPDNNGGTPLYGERCHRSSSAAPLLSVADSEGNITLHEWREQSFTQVDSIMCAPSDTLCLSLDWSNRRTGTSNLGSLVVSLSNGSLCLLTPTVGLGLAVTETWQAHDYEPWVAAWNCWDTSVIYSGGDDLKLKAWDIRQGFMRPTFVNKRFEAGVTSIQSHPYVEHILAVGSYNNAVHIFDARKMTATVAQVDVGGGAWRVKWHPSERRKQDLLVACMHDGFKVIHFDAASDGLSSLFDVSRVLKRNDDHESMAYGADWSHAGPLMSGETLIGGCSFYDHKMSLWSA